MRVSTGSKTCKYSHGSVPTQLPLHPVPHPREEMCRNSPQSNCQKIQWMMWAAALLKQTYLFCCITCCQCAGIWTDAGSIQPIRYVQTVLGHNTASYVFCSYFDVEGCDGFKWIAHQKMSRRLLTRLHQKDLWAQSQPQKFHHEDFVMLKASHWYKDYESLLFWIVTSENAKPIKSPRPVSHMSCVNLSHGFI